LRLEESSELPGFFPFVIKGRIALRGCNRLPQVAIIDLFHPIHADFKPLDAGAQNMQKRV